MDPLCGPYPAFGISDDPTHSIPGGNRTGADKLLPLLQGHVRDLPRRGVQLIERAVSKGVDLHRVDVAVAGRLHPCGGIGFFDALTWIAGFRPGMSAMERLELPRQRQ